MSKQIRSLEQMVDIGLFDRSEPRIMLTKVGQALIPMAHGLLNQAAQVEESMASLRSEVVGLLKMGCSAVVARCILPGLLAQFRKIHPQVHINCNVTSHTRALQMLVDGEVHVAFASRRVPHRNIEYRTFLTDRIILVVPPDHPWAHSDRPLKPDKLTREPIILREEEASARSALSDALASHDMSLNDLNVVLTLGSAEPINSGNLARIEVEGMNPGSTIYVARHTGRPATRAQNAFWELAFSSETEVATQRCQSRPPKNLSWHDG